MPSRTILACGLEVVFQQPASAQRPSRRRGSDRVIPSDIPKDDSKSRLGDCLQYRRHPSRCRSYCSLGSGPAYERGSSRHEPFHHYCGRECAIAAPAETAAHGSLARPTKLRQKAVGLDLIMRGSFALSYRLPCALMETANVGRECTGSRNTHRSIL